MPCCAVFIRKKSKTYRRAFLNIGNEDFQESTTAEYLFKGLQERTTLKHHAGIVLAKGDACALIPMQDDLVYLECN